MFRSFEDEQRNKALATSMNSLSQLGEHGQSVYAQAHGYLSALNSKPCYEERCLKFYMPSRPRDAICCFSVQACSSVWMCSSLSRISYHVCPCLVTCWTSPGLLGFRGTLHIVSLSKYMAPHLQSQIGVRSYYLGCYIRVPIFSETPKSKNRQTPKRPSARVRLETALAETSGKEDTGIVRLHKSRLGQGV